MTRTTWERIQKDGPLSPTWLSHAMARLIQTYSARGSFCNLPGAPHRSPDTPHNPGSTTDTAYHVLPVWAIPRSLATTSGVAYCFPFLQVLRCFNSLGWPPRPMHSVEDRRGLPGGVVPFGDPRVSLLPANRGLSQVATSFIASRCQGIHHRPLVAWPKIVTVALPPKGKRAAHEQSKCTLQTCPCCTCIQLSKTA